MEAAQRLQMLLCLVVWVTARVSSTLLLLQKQRYASLGTIDSRNYSLPRLFLPNGSEVQLNLNRGLAKDSGTYFPFGESRQPASEAWGEDATLALLLVTVVKQELRRCDLVLACSAFFCGSKVLQSLLTLPNIRQVVKVSSAKDLVAINWVPNRCGGYLILLQYLEPLLAYTMTHHHSWDYAGRYIVVSSSMAQLDALAASRNGKKTQHLVGVIKIGRDKWRLYVNQLYWLPGLMAPVATFTQTGFNVQEPNLFPDKVADLRGTVLKVSTFSFEPSVMYRRAENGSLLYRFGEEISLTNAIGETWGQQAVDGSWSGIIGELQRDEADIVVDNLYVSSRRVEFLDFTDPFQVEMACFLARTEPPLPRWQALAFPFTEWTWLAILVGLVTLGPTLWLVAITARLCGAELGSLGHLAFSWYYVFGLHFCKAQVSLPRVASIRILVLFLLLYCMTLTIVYSSSLTAFLLVRRPHASIETIEDLYRSGLEVAALGTIYLDGIMSASDSYLRGLSRTYRGYTSSNEVFPRVLAGKAVYLESRGFAQFHLDVQFTRRGVSSMRFMKECFAPYNIAMALQRHSPLKRKFDEVIGWIQQSGLLYHYFHESVRLAATTKEYSGEGRMASEEERVVVPLTTDHLQGVFFVTGICMAFPFLVFVLEKLISE